MLSRDAASVFQNDGSADIDDKETSDSENSSSGYGNEYMKVRKSQTSKFSPVESDNEDDSSISEGLDPIPIGNKWLEKDV